MINCVVTETDKHIHWNASCSTDEIYYKEKKNCIGAHPETDVT